MRTTRRGFLKGLGVGAVSSAVPLLPTVETSTINEPAHKWLLIAEFEVTRGFVSLMENYLKVELSPTVVPNVPLKVKPQTFKAGGGEVFVFNPDRIRVGEKFVGKVQKRFNPNPDAKFQKYKRVIIKPAEFEKGDCIPYSDKEFTLKIARYFISCDNELDLIQSHWRL